MLLVSGKMEVNLVKPDLQIRRSPPSSAQSEPILEGVALFLLKPTWLIALLNSTQSHCQAVIPMIRSTKEPMRC